MSLVFIFAILSIIQALYLKEANAKHQISKRISRGPVVERRELFPYQVQVHDFVLNSKFISDFNQASIRELGVHRCGGTIISDEHILTTFICCLDDDSQIIDVGYLTVVIGDLKLKRTNMSVEVRVADIVAHNYHKEYNPENNIAVIKVSKILEIYSNKIQNIFQVDKQMTPWTKFIRSIPLANQSLLNMNKMDCLISGWGALKPDVFIITLLKIQ